MQFRIYDRQTLGYKDGGYVASYKIDDDYIVNNNSSIKIAKELNDKVVVGDTIVLIQTSGAYHKGTITNFDNADFSINYKSDKELFNDNMLNPFIERFISDDEEVKIAGKFGITDVANIIDTYFGESNDWAKILPLKIITEGDVLDDDGNVKMLWNWNNNSINVVDWLVNLFERYNLSLSWTVDFNIANTITCEIDSNGKLKTIYNGKNYTLNVTAEDYYGAIEVNIEKEIFRRHNLPKQVKFLGYENESFQYQFDLYGYINNTYTLLQRDVSLISYGITLGSFDAENDSYIDIIQDGDKSLLITNNRNPYYIVTLSAVINSGKIIKDNVANQTITYTEKELPEATVCILIDKDSKQIVQMSSGVNLINPANVKEHKILSYNDVYHYVQEEDSAGTNVTGFIEVDVTKPYTYSWIGTDGNIRRIMCYDKDKTPFWSFTYYGENPDEHLRYIKHINFTNEEFPTVQDIADTKYIRINYYVNSTEVQLEQNTEFTAYDPYDKAAVYYLLNVAGRNLITLDVNSLYRVFPVKTKIVEFDNEGEDTTEEQVAYENLVPSKFNQAIEIRISKDSKTFDFENVLYGDQFKIINEQGVIESNYTGRKEESNSKWVTLYFGLGRQNYTDLVQMRMRKNKYQVVYNQAK